MQKTTIYRNPMSESLFEEEFTISALSEMGNSLEQFTALIDLTNLVYNIFRYIQINNYQPQLITCKG